MVAISTTVGYEMSGTREAQVAVSPEPEIFVVRFRSHDADLRAMDAMGRIDRVFTKENGDNVINRKQLEELRRLEIPYKIVASPPSYKPTPVTKTLRS
jgi:hypothetical protein